MRVCPQAQLHLQVLGLSSEEVEERKIVLQRELEDLAALLARLLEEDAAFVSQREADEVCLHYNAHVPCLQQRRLTSECIPW